MRSSTDATARLLLAVCLLAALGGLCACGSSRSAGAQPSDAGHPIDSATGADGPAPRGDGGSSGDAGSDAPILPSCGPAGSLDTAFGEGGVLVTQDPMAIQTDPTLAVVSDGAEGLYVGFSPLDKMIADTTESATLSVVHLDASGVVDDSFGTGGRADATYPNVVGFEAIRRGSVTGAIYLLGSSAEQGGASTLYSDTIVRLSPSGAVDKSFGGDGHVQLDADPGGSGIPENGFLADLVEEGDGTLLLLTGAGFVHLSATGTELDSTLASVFPDVQDPGYLRFLPAAAGSVLIVGAWPPSLTAMGDGPTAARFTPALAVDATFGSGGQIAPAIGQGASSFPHAGRADHGMFLGGATQIAAFDANGSPTSTFGTAGIATVGGAVVASLARSDNSVVYVTSPPIEGPITINALTTSGTADKTFGASGSLNIPKSITLTNPTQNVDGQYVGATQLVPAAGGRGYLVSTYNAYDGTKTFTGLYVVRFCLD